MNDLRDNSKAKEFFTREWGTVCKYRTLDFVPTYLGMKCEAKRSFLYPVLANEVNCLIFEL